MVGAEWMVYSADFDVGVTLCLEYGLVNIGFDKRLFIESEKRSAGEMAHEDWVAKDTEGRETEDDVPCDFVGEIDDGLDEGLLL